MRNTGSAQERIDLRDLTESAILYAGSFARPVGARIAFDRPARAVVIEADADQIQIALNNLLRNAIEAVAALPAHRPRDIRIVLRQRQGAVELAVGDSGPGWTHDITPGHFPESTKPGGTGLGLFIVHTAAENHGARLEMSRSALGGAEVHLTFPKPTKKYRHSDQMRR
jgi:nitrogen fixation/metabolism regulation signal transduction histidine kinase